MFGTLVSGLYQAFANHSHNKAHKDYLLMTLPKSLKAYQECEEHFEQALESPKGIAVRLADRTQAIRYSHKLNGYRVRLRRQNKEIYDPSHPLYNASPYDALRVTIDKEDDSRVLIQPYVTKVLDVEPL